VPTGNNLFSLFKFPTFSPPSTGKATLPQLGLNNQSFNNGGLTINTNVNVDGSSTIDETKLKKMFERLNIDLVNKIKMSGAVNKVGK
jgi:hypothetical protein